MPLLDPAIRRFGRFRLGLAASLIGEVCRRRGSGSRRTPENLLLRDASGLPGPALVEPIADWDALLIPSEIDSDQAKDLARAAGRIALDGAVERLLDAARELPRTVRGIPGAICARPWPRQRSQADDQMPGFDADQAERAAWDRFLAAHDAFAETQAAHELSPSDLTAEELRWAEVELEDAVAIAGEHQVRNIRWILS